MITFDIVDDHKMFAQGVGSNLHWYNSKLQLGNIYSSGHEYLQRLRTHPHHASQVVLIDYRMPGLLGWHVSHILERDFPHIKKIGISGETKPTWITNFIAAGCKTFISKDEGNEELSKAILAVAANKQYYNRYFTKEMLVPLSKHINHPLGLIENEFFYIQLCPTPLTNKGIAQVLAIEFEEEHHIQKKLFKRFKVETRAELTNIAIANKIITISMVVE